MVSLGVRERDVTRLAQGQQVGGADGEIHIEWVNAFDRGQQRAAGARVAGGAADQGALRDLLLAGGAADRRGDAGVTQVDARGRDGRLIGFDFRGGAALRCVGIVHGLLRYRADGQQLVIAVCGHAVVRVRRLIFGQDRQGVVEDGGVVGRIDLEQDLACLDLTALLVGAPDEHPRHAGDDVGAVIRRQAPDQVPCQRYRLLFGRHRADLGGRGRGGLLVRTASGDGQHDETR